MDRREQDLHRAEEARALLANPLLQAAFDELRAECIEQIAAANVNDVGTVRNLMLMVKTVDKVRAIIERHVQTGAIVAKDIERLTRERNIFGMRKTV